MNAAEKTSVVISPEKIKTAVEGCLFAEVWTAEGDEVPLNTYAVLDGASIPDLLDHLYADQDRPEFVCLYRGEMEPDIAEVAPYLVRLERGTPFADWLLAECWPKHFGIFVRSLVELQTLRRHFRRFLRVKSPDGRTLYFRFYDPRVLSVFLPTCSSEQLSFIFGPVQCWFAEREDRPAIESFSIESGQLVVRQLVLGASGKPSSIA